MIDATIFIKAQPFLFLGGIGAVLFLIVLWIVILSNRRRKPDRMTATDLLYQSLTPDPWKFEPEPHKDPEPNLGEAKIPPFVWGQDDKFNFALRNQGNIDELLALISSAEAALARIHEYAIRNAKEKHDGL